ncbi:uncharacterized protein LOC9637875 isoform X2 [Selaginella moellendorffii]|uniref:uncharacterized protein LOC9637875 isoform X2 n=1 Tax=Selaginella moellendorffii TaxID=88036 RepID=UPI000D1CD2F5|nr:uncharacterized protein LOC9637875 isoform X2 [Selaginella moellendorffii]|eukprot:XP_024535752.1 uncharacterized protein LOC9637875 isoform X2 [Selaginella moellendorffii]
MNTHREAYSLGARIHSDSWTTVDRSYNLMSRSVDAFTYNNPAFLPVFAAGNAGSSYSSVGTITSPAMSKNSLTVGASMGPGHSIRHENLALLRFYVLNGTSDLRVGVLENSFGVMFQDNWGPFPLLRAIPGEACISPPNAAGMVVLASREGCDCIDKLVAIQDAGSVAAVFFNNENTGYFPLSLRSSLESITIPSGSIPRVFGDYLDSMLTHGDSVFVEVVGHVPFNGERIDSMTSFSSWGPTLDGRQKPETVAPGDKIVSARSNMGSKEATCRTLVLSGTSMATPITAGGAALIRQYFMDGFYPTGSKVLAHSRQPSGALVKAILINGAVPLRGLNGNGVIIDPPLSFNQGYGRIDLLHSLFLPGHNKLNVTAEEGNPLKTGFGQRYCFSCFPGSEDLKFTLAWYSDLEEQFIFVSDVICRYDPPALPAASVILVNDLDLFVIDPSNTKRYGNGGPRPDRMNNVEQVSVSDPESGLYVAVIYGYYVPEEGPDGLGQRFAFVASAASLSATPCLVINPVEVPPLFGNIANVRITVEGTSGPYIKWFCRLDASIETPKGHDWEICGNDYFAEGLPDAFYTFSVQARDESFLNTAYSEISFASFTIDTIPPRTILLSSSASVFCETAVFEFSSDSADTDHFECQFTSGILSSHGWTLCGSPVKVEARSDGRYTFHVRAVDKAGNQDPQPVFVHWLLHRERPRAKIVTILPKDLTNVSTCRVYFELDVPNLPGIQEPRWSCRLNLSDIEGAAVYGWRSCSSPLELSNLPDGIYIVSVRAAENESGGALSSVPATCTVTIDSLPPEVLFFAVPPLFSSSRDVSYAFASSEVSTTTCCMTKLNTAEEERWQQCTSPARFRNLEDGVYQFSVTATDLAGNTGLVIKHRFLVDTTPPSVVSFVLSQPDLDVVTAEFSVDDGPLGSTSGVATSYCRLDSQVQGGTWIPCSSPWRVEQSYLAPGVEHTFMVKAEDRASNIALDHAEQKLVLTSNSSAVHGLVCPEAYTRLQIATLAFNSSLSWTECEVDEQVFVACGSPYHVGPLVDGAHTFKVRYLSSFSLWSGCKWYIDTGTPETLIRSSVVNTLSPSFELSGYDGGGIERYECMLQSLDPQGQRHSWRKCSRQLVTYSLCPASLYIFHARSIDAAGNVDPNPPQAIFLISYSFFYHSAFSSDVSTNSSYRICRTPGTCKFPLSQSGTIVSTYDGATIIAFPKSLRKSHYELSSSPYASAALSGNALDMGIVARLCVPVSNVSSLASTSYDEQPFAIFLMLRKTNESSPTVPLAISTGNATPNYTNELQLIYTRESPILVTTMWELVAAQLDQEGTYVTTLVTRPGSYMLARIYEGPTLAFIKASQPRMIVSSTTLIFMCLCIFV